MSQEAQSSGGAESSSGALSRAPSGPPSDNATKYITWVPPLEIIETDDRIVLVAYGQLSMRQFTLSTSHQILFREDGTKTSEQLLTISMCVRNTLIKYWNPLIRDWQGAGQYRTKFTDATAKFTIRVPDSVGQAPPSHDANSRFLRYNKNGFIIQIPKTREAKLCDHINVQMEVD